MYIKLHSICIFLLLTILTVTHCKADNNNHDKSRQTFESVLASGRTLAFPYTTGLILSAFSSQSQNWNVSLYGINEILDLSRDQLLVAYKDATDIIKQVCRKI
jgi:hypothetical protein